MATSDDDDFVSETDTKSSEDVDTDMKRELRDERLYAISLPKHLPEGALKPSLMVCYFCGGKRRVKNLEDIYNHCRDLSKSKKQDKRVKHRAFLKLILKYRPPPPTCKAPKKKRIHRDDEYDDDGWSKSYKLRMAQEPLLRLPLAHSPLLLDLPTLIA